MEPTVIIIAGAAALAVILIAVGLTSALEGEGINSRLSRYMPRADDATGEPINPPSWGELLAASRTMDVLNKAVEKQDFGASLGRELARADLRLRVSEYLLLWAITIAGIP